MIELTAAEEKLILAQREQRKAARSDSQRESLLAQLDDFSRTSTNRGFGQLPRDLDEPTLKAVNAVIQIALAIKDEYGTARPTLIPPMLALKIVLALRGEEMQAPPTTGGLRVPD